jgi:hypothetical protein
MGTTERVQSGLKAVEFAPEKKYKENEACLEVWRARIAHSSTQSPSTKNPSPPHFTSPDSPISPEP